MKAMMRNLSVGLTAMALAGALAVAGPGAGPGPAGGPGCGKGCCAKRAEASPGGGGAGCCRGGGGARARRGHGGGGPGAARNADGHHDVIQTLLDDHGKIRREVEIIDDGVVTTTVSDDPAVTAKIREHVRQMEARMASGRGVRHWDPLFVEIFRHHDAIRMDVEEIDGGVRVRETSDDPEVRKLIRQHATRGVSEFVERGRARAHEPTPLPEDYRVEEVAAAATEDRAATEER